MTELEQAYERINETEDLLGDCLAYLEGDPGSVNAKPGLIEFIKSYFAARLANRAASNN